MEPNAIRKAGEDGSGMRSRYLSYGADLDLLFRKVSAFLVLGGYKVQSDRRRLTLVAVQEKALTVIEVTLALRIVGEPDDFTLEIDRDVSQMVKDTTLAGLAAWALAPFTLGLSVAGTAGGGEAVCLKAESDIAAFVAKEMEKLKASRGGAPTNAGGSESDA
jgi:hypothetical protein